MAESWTIIISPEVAQWYRKLNATDQMMTDKMIELLQAYGNQLRMPHSKPLGDGLFELRFALQHNTIDQRITYVFDPERRIITLTTFHKTQNNQAREVTRARQAKKAYERKNENE